MNRLATTTAVACLAWLCASCSNGGDTSNGDTKTNDEMTGGGAGASAGAHATSHADAGSADAAAAVQDDGSAPSDSSDGTADGGMAMSDLLGTIPSARGKCDLHTDFAGDDACLAPPDPDKGFQIHIGPSNYDDPDEIAKFVMEPGGESDECFMKKTPNDKDIQFFVWELSGRPGTHHIINTMLSTDLPEGWGSCENFGPGGNSIGSLGGASRAHMPPTPVAPENARLGIPVAAHTQVQHDMHYYNVTDKPLLREFWMNVYYVDPTQVEETPQQIAGLGGLGWNFRPIQPGTHQVFQYECPIDKDGRIIQLLGHTHAHALRETAYIRRANGDRLKVFEQYNYLEPAIFNYDSLTKNPEFSGSSPGAYSGLLDVAAGDALDWECEVNNDSSTPLAYTNEVQTGEMCNIWGMSVGPTLSCFLQ